jgi:hypothetical protein
MPDFLRAAFPSADVSPAGVLVRLVAAMLLGAVVAFIYRRTRPASDLAQSFQVTLVLLSILIAMVTQVIGDNVARAFSLVGALSIVRFRTVVRDTQDTAFVIFAVAVGMAVGAGHPVVAASGIAIVGVAAWVMTGAQAGAAAVDAPFELHVRIGLGHEPERLLAEVLATYAASRRVTSIATTRQGMAIEVSYRIALRREDAAGDLVKALNRLEGVQGVTLERTPWQEAKEEV